MQLYVPVFFCLDAEENIIIGDRATHQIRSSQKKETTSGLLEQKEKNQECSSTPED